MMPQELRLGFKIAPEWYCWLLFIISTWQLSTVSIVRIYSPWFIAGLMLGLCDLSRLRRIFDELKDSKIQQLLKHLAVLVLAITYCPFTFAIKPTFDHALPPALPLTIWQGSEQMKPEYAELQAALLMKKPLEGPLPLYHTVTAPHKGLCHTYPSHA
mmetsp:Transcript_13965/g.11916  ORF Transcript_13965/g.11916 Transcript_13965/m.11916 type:complete len:157 (-) Transcript_13965:667-1137(-)